MQLPQLATCMKIFQGGFALLFLHVCVSACAIGWPFSSSFEFRMQGSRHLKFLNARSQTPSEWIWHHRGRNGSLVLRSVASAIFEVLASWPMPDDKAVTRHPDRTGRAKSQRGV